VIEFADEGFEGGSWNVAQRAAEKLLSQGGQSSSQGGEFVGVGGGDFLVDTLAVGGGARGDFGLALAVPFYDGGFGDVEAAANGGQAETLDAEAEEFVAR